MRFTTVTAIVCIAQAANQGLAAPIPLTEQELVARGIKDMTTAQILAQSGKAMVNAVPAKALRVPLPGAGGSILQKGIQIAQGAGKTNPPWKHFPTPKAHHKRDYEEMEELVARGIKDMTTAQIMAQSGKAMVNAVPAKALRVPLPGAGGSILQKGIQIAQGSGKTNPPRKHFPTPKAHHRRDYKEMEELVARGLKDMTTAQIMAQSGKAMVNAIPAKALRVPLPGAGGSILQKGIQLAQGAGKTNPPRRHFPTPKAHHKRDYEEMEELVARGLKDMTTAQILAQSGKAMVNAVPAKALRVPLPGAGGSILQKGIQIAQGAGKTNPPRRHFPTPKAHHKREYEDVEELVARGFKDMTTGQIMAQSGKAMVNAIPAKALRVPLPGAGGSILQKAVQIAQGAGKTNPPRRHFPTPKAHHKRGLLEIDELD